MALRIRFQYTSGASLGYSIERLGDGLFYDFSDGTFKVAPTTLVSGLTADAGSFSGRYKATVLNTPAAQFANGDYCITVHDTANSNLVVGTMAATMFNGDDTTAFPSGSGADPWAVALPGSYPAGTAGAILSANLDAKMSSRLASTSYVTPPTAAQVATAVWTDTAGSDFSVADSAGSRLAAAAADPWSAVLPGNYPAGTAGAILGTNLDAPVSSRSTYAGGPVASVAAPVTVGTNNDKAGYVLSAAGLDAVPVENGVNARQALSPILAACAGSVAGAGTGSVAIKGANVATTRIMATTDSAGNRTAVTLVLPN